MGTRTEMSTRTEMGMRAGAGTETRIEKRVDGGEREPGNLRNGNRGGSEDARGESMPTINQQSQSQDPTHQRDRHTMWRTESRDGRRGTGSSRAGERRRSARNPRIVVDVTWKREEAWAEGEPT